MVGHNFFKLTLLISIWLGFTAHAAEVTMGFGDKLPPFCIPGSESGIEVDIVREALAYRGHTLKPIFYPIRRVPMAFISKNLDAAMMDSGVNLLEHEGIYAEPAVLYDNVFISLKKKHLKILKPEDLKGLSVIAFPGALTRFPEWLEPVRKSGRYAEINDQSLQVKALVKEHFDLALSDRMIFRYFLKQAEPHRGPEYEVVEHDFIQPNPRDYRLIFRNKGVAQDYEAGLRHLKKTGRYQAIYDSYSK